MKLAAPWRWLRTLMRTLRLWPAPTAAESDVACRRGLLDGGASYAVALPPVPQLDPPAAEVAAAIATVRERLLQGRPFASFATLAERGVVVFAQLEDGAKQPAVLVIAPDDRALRHFHGAAEG
jgi:hypothetical protein